MAFHSLITDTLKYLETHEGPIFASVDDCNYFRSLYKKPTPPPPPKPVEVALPPPPPPPPKVEPPPPPKPVVCEVHKPEPIKPKAFTNDWWGLFAKTSPELALLRDIPSDALAKKINTRWKTKNQIAPITILTFQETPPLLEQIATAIDVHFGPARLVQAESIEKEKQWEAFLSASDLRHVVCCDYTLWQLSGLMKFYKEIPASKTRQLGEKPLFLLPDLSLYLKDPMLKRSLWKALCQTLSLSSSTKI